ncbi:hypothetical protein [Endozoicomonas arenosclerae]|uniref:hypothetical protein n=1 Tax=Endozoicomonas arenosclerae TaxID=1633495 RepID=UPI000782C521|nr:hypothetical protein [Endozoicomonas arenosclerae]
MKQEILNKAGSKLTLGGVFLYRSSVEFCDNYITEVDDNFEAAYSTQSYRYVRECNQFQSEDDNGNVVFLYKFIYEVGLRLVDPEQDQQDEEFIKSEIEASYSVEYASNEELDQEQIAEFSKHNVAYHVWPYWREFVQNSCMRVGASPIIVPLYTQYQQQAGQEK